MKNCSAKSQYLPSFYTVIVPPTRLKLQLFSHQDPFEASQDRQRQHEVGGILTKNTFISSPEAISRPPPDCLEMTQSLSLVMFKLPPHAPTFFSFV